MTAARERGLTVGAKHNGFINLADGRVGFNISAVRAEADRPGAHWASHHLKTNKYTSGQELCNIKEKKKL